MELVILNMPKEGRKKLGKTILSRFSMSTIPLSWAWETSSQSKSQNPTTPRHHTQQKRTSTHTPFPILDHYLIQKPFEEKHSSPYYNYSEVSSLLSKIVLICGYYLFGRFCDTSC